MYSYKMLLNIMLICMWHFISGYDPDELRGRNIGVFIGNCSSESDEFFTIDPKKINGYAMTGCCRAMFANRVSYTFDFKGIRYTLTFIFQLHKIESLLSLLVWIFKCL